MADEYAPLFVGTIQNGDDLRRAIVAGIDDALSRPVLSRFISAETARVMRAERDYWQHADATQLERLLSLYNREP